MKKNSYSKHFAGKDVVAHLKEARQKGARATGEMHGLEPPGHLNAGSDAAKEMAILWAVVTIVLLPLNLGPSITFLTLTLAAIGLTIWKVGRSALLGWSRLERLHRLIEEERWEIEHHRAQEKKELIEMYRAKGFEGELLHQVVEVLMADDNRLLQVMLEEELGLSLETYEHPLKQASGSAIGAISSALICGLGFFFGGMAGVAIAGGIVFAVTSLISAVAEKNERMKAIVWNLAVGTLATASLYFIVRMATP